MVLHLLPRLANMQRSYWEWFELGLLQVWFVLLSISFAKSILTHPGSIPDAEEWLSPDPQLLEASSSDPRSAMPPMSQQKREVGLDSEAADSNHAAGLLASPIVALLE